jgi:hypothetical protein
MDKDLGRTLSAAAPAPPKPARAGGWTRDGVGGEEEEVWKKKDARHTLDTR